MKFHHQALLAGIAGTVLVALSFRVDAQITPPAPRAPELDEIQVRIFQYATGDHALDVRCDGTEPTIYELAVDRPFEYRIEPRWKGGSEPQDVITEVKVDVKLAEADEYDSAWTELVHHGPMDRNRELAQIGQHVTLSRDDSLLPAAGNSLIWRFRVDWQLGSQSGPKRTCEAYVAVHRA